MFCDLFLLIIKHRCLFGFRNKSKSVESSIQFKSIEMPECHDE